MTTTYNYHEAVTADIIDYIRDNYDMNNLPPREELEETLRDDLWTDDNVTGNGNGTYTFNRREAEEYICQNLDLLAEACEEFGSYHVLRDGAEACDVTIRCYLLGDCIGSALDELGIFDD